MKSVTTIIPPDGRSVNFLFQFRKLFPEQHQQVLDVVAEANMGLEVTISAYRPHHSSAQQGYYHMWKKAFSDFTGNTPDEVHEHLLNECFGSEYRRTMLGIMKRPLKRSSAAKVDEYSQLIEVLIRVAAEMGFTVPPPIRRGE